MRNPFLLTLAFIAMISCMALGAAAQETGTVQETETAQVLDEHRGRNIGTHCMKFEQTSAPCDAYIKEYYGPKSDLIMSIVNAIDRQKDRARDEAAFSKHSDRWLTGTLIVLAFLTTLFAAVARTYKNDEYPRLQRTLGLIPIALSAFVTMFATFNAYYKFDESRARNTFVAEGLAKLQSQINFDLIEYVVDARESNLDLKDIRLWRDEFETIMSKYSPAKPGNRKGIAPPSGGT